MARYKRKVKGMDRLFAAYKSMDHVEIYEALQKDATRQANEMAKWKDLQEKFDPEGNLLVYEDVFPLVVKAVKYRHRLYKATARISQIKREILKGQHEARKAGEVVPDYPELKGEWLDLEDKVIVLSWRIRKIYCAVISQVQMQTFDGVDGEEFEDFDFDYNPEKYG